MSLRIVKREKAEVKTYRQTAVNAVIVVVVLILFLYVGIQFSRNFSSQVSTLRTQTVTDVEYFYLEGYIFNQGEVLTHDGDIVHYLVSDGEKVGVGQAYAEIYSDTSVPADKRAATEERLNSLSEQITLLEDGMENAKNTSDLGAISDEISKSYYSYIDSVLGGDFVSADKSGDVLVGALVDHSSITLSESAANALSGLVEERDALIASIGGKKRVLVSDCSFTFFYTPDGYEDIFDPSRLDGLTRDALDSLIASSPIISDRAMGRALHSSKWQIVIPTDTAGYATFKDNVGSTYEIGFPGEDISLEMLLEDAVSDEENTESSYLIFSSLDITKMPSAHRLQTVRVKLSSSTGYRIPEGALHHQNNNDGVYILVGNMIEFRRVTVTGKGDGYYIADTYETDLAEGSLGEYPYLSANDLIVTSGRDLYDGKRLD